MPQRDYAFGFHDEIAPLYSTGKGLTEAVVREISAIKKEPQWMLDYRLRSLELFNKLPMRTLVLICQAFDLKMSSITRN